MTYIVVNLKKKKTSLYINSRRELLYWDRSGLYMNDAIHIYVIET